MGSGGGCRGVRVCGGDVRGCRGGVKGVSPQVLGGVKKCQKVSPTPIYRLTLLY
jgi:hypothetical protein